MRARNFSLCLTSPYLWHFMSTALVWLAQASTCDLALVLGHKAVEQQSWGTSRRLFNPPPPSMNTGEIRDFPKRSQVGGKARTENPGLQAPSPDVSAPYDTDHPSGDTVGPTWPCQKWLFLGERQHGLSPEAMIWE